MLRFDPNLRWLFTEVPMLERYDAAARAGFRGVEVAFPYDIEPGDMVKLLGRNGLSLVQVLSPMDWAGGERGIAALPDRVDDARKSIDFAIRYSAQVGRPFVHVMAGNIPKGADVERCLETFAGNLAYAASLAQPEGITIIIEAVCRARFPDFLYKTLDESIAIIDRVGHKNVKLCFDTYHVQMQEGDITGNLERVFPYIGHMQLGNPPGRNEPGVGELDLAYFLQQVERLAWPGWIGLEYAPSVETLQSLAWAAPYGIHRAVEARA